ncbi:MAG: hypothetical protein AAF916_07820 [Planctomycetota bacterium]
MSDPLFRCKACGKGFRWKPELAGRTTRCKCGATLQVPDAPDEVTQRPPEPPPPPPATPGKCVNCNAKLKDGAVICVRCGTDQRTRQTQTTRTGEEIVPMVPGDTDHHSRDDGDPFASGGMLAVELGIWAALCAIALSAAGVLLPIIGLAAGYDLDAWTGVASGGSALLNVLAVVLMLCVPSAAGARWLLFAALGCLIGAIVTAVFTTGIWDTSFTGLGLAIASTVLSFTAVVLFLVFLKQLADFFGFGEVTEKADKVIGLYIILGIAKFAICIPFVGLLILALAIYTFWLYVSLLIDLYRAAHYRRTQG